MFLAETLGMAGLRSPHCLSILGHLLGDKIPKDKDPGLLPHMGAVGSESEPEPVSQARGGEGKLRGALWRTGQCSPQDN